VETIKKAKYSFGELTLKCKKLKTDSKNSLEKLIVLKMFLIILKFQKMKNNFSKKKKLLET